MRLPANRSIKLAALAILMGFAAVGAQAGVVIHFGNDNQVGGASQAEIPGVSGDINQTTFSGKMDNTSEASPYTVGTFSALPSGNPGSGVSFDIAARSGGPSANFRSQPLGLGIPGGANSAIDNSSGNLEWMSLELQNVTGLGAGDQLVITSIEILYTGASETYRLDIGTAGSAPIASDAFFSEEDPASLVINNSAFTLGAGNGGDSRFALGAIEIDVISAPPNVSYSPASLTEATANDGSISTPLTITLSNDSFTADVVSGGHVTASNVPAGLSPVFTRDSDTEVTLSFTGNALSHTEADSINNLTVTFANGAFTGGNAGAVVDSTRNDFNLTFADPPSLDYSPAGQTEAVANDGSISTSITITLSNESFTSNVVSGGHVTAGNVPAGLSPVFTRDSDTEVTLSFTGNAVSHTDADSINNLTVTFANGAFTGGNAGAVVGATRSDLSLTFADTAPPNILMLCIDDMNDWVGFLGGHPQTKTPNMDSLAAMGANFSNAHCPAPGCSPSRNAIMFGAEPTRTGLYPFYRLIDLNATDNATIDAFLPMPQFFRDNGYYTAGYTKIWHNPERFYKPDEQWDDYFYYGQSGLDLVDDPKYYYPTDKLQFGPAQNPATDFQDRKSADAAIRILQRTHDRPFFLAVGFILPHLPFVAPLDNFNRFDFPIEPPPILAGDLADIPLVGRSNAKLADDVRFKQDNAWEKVRRAYLASISFTDDNVGLVLEELAAGPYADNTIIVLWSDHGFHLGEKQSFRKFSLWEEATRTPFIIYDPRGRNANGQTLSEPVSLIDLYRTLADLTGLTPPAYVDGVSLVPWLDDPVLPKDIPAMTTWGRGNYTLRSTDWRYTRYHDGSEELYHNAVDPNEWTNLADDPDHSAVKTELAAYLPTSEAPQIQSGRELYNVSDADSPNNQTGTYNNNAATYEAQGLQPPINGYNFSDWIEENGYIGDDAEPGADPNENGVPNLIEYAVKVPEGGEAHDYLPDLAFEQVATTDHLAISFRRRLDAPDLRYEIVGSNDLSVWDSFWDSDTPTNTYLLSTTYNADGTQSITVRHRDGVDEPAAFLRLGVSAP